MQDTQLNRISNFLWSVSDDLLRDLYVRGKYRDVILPMTVLRRPRRRPRTHQAEGPQRETVPRRQRHHRTRRRASTGGRPRLLQHVAVHAARPGSPRRPAGATGRLRGILGRLFRQRPGNPGLFRVPQPNQPPLTERRPRGPNHQVPLTGHQPQPLSGQERRRIRQIAQLGQPRHGHNLRGPRTPFQRGKQRGSRRTLDATRRRRTHGSAGVSASC